MLALSIENLSASYPGRGVAFKQLEWHCEGDASLVFFGDAHSGARELLRLLGGIDTSSSGKINVNEGLLRLGIWAPPKISFWGKLGRYVEREVGDFLKKNKISLHDLLVAFGLDYAKELKARALSQEEVYLLQALLLLVQNPSGFFLEDPVDLEDSAQRQQCLKRISSFCRKWEISFFLSTQDPLTALAYGDRLICLRDGRIEQDDSAPAVYALPASVALARSLGDANWISGRVIRSGGGFAMVQTVMGEIQGVLPDFVDNFEVDEPVLLRIRPESFRFLMMEVDENCWEGQLESATYMGAFSEFQICCGEAHLVVYEANAPFYQRKMSEELILHVEAEDIVVYPSDS